jgi:hypothetical protein
MDDTTKNFLKTLEEINGNKFDVYCPYSEKKVKANPLSFKQQKDLISTLTDGTLGVIQFQKILNNILSENTGEDLYVLDKVAAIIKIRCESIGKEITIDGVKVDIAPVLEKIDKVKYPKLSPIKHDQFTVNLYVPTLKEEIRIINSIIDDLKKDSKDLGKSIVNVYTHEIVKFVESILIGEDLLDFKSLPVKERINIVEKLPLSTNKAIIKEIENLKKVETELLTVEVNGEEKSFDIDVSFFDS